MKMTSRFRSRDGAILLMALVLVMILAIMGMGLMSLGEHIGMETSRDVTDANAFWAAEAGLEFFKSRIGSNNVPLGSISYSGSSLLGGSFMGTMAKGAFTVSASNYPGNPNTSYVLPKKYMIYSRGTSGASSCLLTLSATLGRFPCGAQVDNTDFNSRYASPSPYRIYFLPGDVIDGPVYVNDVINIYGGSPMPRFLQKVYTASSVWYENSATPSVFEGGLQTNATSIGNLFNGGALINDLKSMALQTVGGGLALTNAGSYNLLFTNISNNGSLIYYGISGAATNVKRSTNDLSTMNGAIYVNGDAYVQGVVNGTVTVAAQNAIYITNGIVYASALNPTPWASNFVPANVTDTLGLIALNQVQVLGDNSINIHAAIMVCSNNYGFGAATWSSPRSGNRPDINLYGSLAQYQRGVVAQGSSYGFDKNYKFDTRFLQISPPLPNTSGFLGYSFSGWTK